jgi:hypothetical protein
MLVTFSDGRQHEAWHLPPFRTTELLSAKLCAFRGLKMLSGFQIWLLAGADWHVATATKIQHQSINGDLDCAHTSLFLG